MTDDRFCDKDPQTTPTVIHLQQLQPNPSQMPMLRANRFKMSDGASETSETAKKQMKNLTNMKDELTS